MRALFSAVILSLALTLTGPAARACETALLLAVDVSSSVDPREYRLQIDGVADALADPEIAHALVRGQVALALMQWSGAGEQEMTLPWQRMTDPAAVADFAAAARGAKRAYVNSNTAPGDLLARGITALDEVRDCNRLIIDVSGDGSANAGINPRSQSQLAARKGIIINGIAIESIGISITQYYERSIITQYGFVITARRHEDYPRAIREKIKREITKVTG